MQVELRFFGPFREEAGVDTVDFETDADAYGELLREIEAAYPSLEGQLHGGDAIAGNTVVSRNKRDLRHLEGLDTPVTDGDVVRLIPSVYGG